MPDRQQQYPEITILTPVYNEEECLLLYKKQVEKYLLSRPEYNFKVLFIEDGSRDRSWEIICDICNRNHCFSGIRLSRNFGSHIALSAGFAHANGDAVATLACDLQDPPEIILEFLKQWKNGAQIIWGHRKSRDDETWRILASKLFYRLLAAFAMPADSKFTTGSFFLVDKKVAECFDQFHEANRTTFALVAWTGFRQTKVDYNRKGRVAGESGWTFNKMMKTMYDTFIGFSFAPIKIMTLMGLIFFLFSIPLLAYLILGWILGDPVVGWSSTMFALTFFFGIQFLLMGISGEYLYRIYVEVVRRPLYFISKYTNELESEKK